jgi:DNA helicase-2/ATP-dependent DNA helicase PcrA
MRASEILRELNPIQQAAVKFNPKQPLLILAGAGSGKTRVLTYRTAYFISELGIAAEDILLLTFTNKAAEEMLRRVKTLVGKDFLGHGGTFHSFCARILRSYAHEAELDQNFVIFDEGDQLDVIRQAEANLGIDPKITRPNSVLGAISDAKNNLISPAEYAGFARGNWSTTVARIYIAYQQLLRRFKALDFDDLLTQTVWLLKTNTGVTTKLANRFQYILVDEYQDTNKAQYEITKELAKGHRRLTVVGDAAQAIYSWRGADYRNLLLLKQDFPELETVNLEQNYRSTEIILSAANKVVEKNKNHPVLKLWTERGGGEKVTIYEAESELEEANYIVKKIQSDKVTKRREYSDYAVLYRTNAQSRVLEEALLHEGIPYVLVGGVRFYERREIKDVLAYLRLVLNPEDEVSRKRAEKNGKVRLKNLEIRFTNYDLEIKTLDILDEVLKTTQYLDQYDPMNEEDAARLENIKELRSVAAEYTNLAEFLERVALTEKEAKSRFRIQDSRINEAVTLMTLHSAKGLEFKTVFMVGMEEGLFPHSRTLMNPDELEEERRLAYVGMTRAMDKLYMTYARRRLYFGTRSNNMVSRFLGDIPQELISADVNGYSGFKTRGKVDPEFGFDSEGNWKWKPDQ